MRWLKACPFCGGEARFVPETPEGDCQAFCVGCEICFSARSIMPEDAIANWNTRALAPALDRVIVELRALSEFERYVILNRLANEQSDFQSDFPGDDEANPKIIEPLCLVLSELRALRDSAGETGDGNG